MAIQDVLGQAQEAMSVKRVFGEPYEKDGVTIVPAASFRGGGGGGGGSGPQGEGSGEGGGYGVTGRPVGAYVFRNGDVNWQPALDINRVVIGGQIVFIVLLLVLRAMSKSRNKRKIRTHV